jgi:hypothetical protein
MEVRHLLRCLTVGLLLLGVMACGDSGRPAPDQFPTSSNLTANRNALGVPYGGWILLVDGERRIALRIDAEDPTGRSIAYRWRAVPAGATTFSDVGVETFQGRTREEQGMGRIVMGTLQMDWSRATNTTGWLYWPPGERPVRAWTFPYPELTDIPAEPEGDWWLTEP